MKKSLFFFAAAAVALTACTSDNDLVQTGPQASLSESRAVTFDTYTAGTTRAGLPEGVMTTDKLKKEDKGFGVYAFHHDNSKWATDQSSIKPNFMFNEHIHWTTSGGWTYSPLKYWPNETLNDSQDPAAVMPGSATPGTQIDKLSFFAYAPYANLTATGTLSNTAATPANVDNATNKYGVVGISDKAQTGDPLVEWNSYSESGLSTPWNTILDHNVDLLWGVAAADADYTAVNNTLVDTEFGKPLIDLVKPDKDQRVKFLFQHALSRIGLTVVSAIDQIAGGDDGGKFTTEQTRVLIDEVRVWGDFGVKGVLNLNNTTANKANWDWATSITKSSSSEASPMLLVNTANNYLAKNLRYDATTISGITAASPTKTFEELNKGVLPSEQVLVAGDADPDKQVESTTPAYNNGTVLYYKDGNNDYVVATTTATESVPIFTYDEKTQNYTQVGAAGASVLDGSQTYYKVTVTSPISSGTTLTPSTVYYKEEGSAPNITYTKFTSDGSGTAQTVTCYLASNVSKTELSGNAYTSNTYYSGLLPRYFMVIPSEQPYVKNSTETTVNVKITYHVVTKDTKLGTTISNVENVITKTEKFQFESGKSYNLKLILGLTSVKLDATVGEWQVGDNAEMWLPKNVE